MRQGILLSSLVILTILFWFADHQYPSPYLRNGFYTFLALGLIQFIFKEILEGIATKGIKDGKTRYSFRKTISIIAIIIMIIVVAGIWAVDTSTLAVAYGLVGAGLAIAFQDIFKNFAGGVTIFVSSIYRVGDRIEVDSKIGDVMDIGIFYTTLMEIGEWVGGDQATGRLTTFPNSYVLTSKLINYTKDHNFVWDEIEIPITYDSDWKDAVTRILRVVEDETKAMTAQAEKEISKLGERFFLHKKVVEPAIFLQLTDNWIIFYIRYITEVRERRILKDKMSRLILEEIQRAENVQIAPTRLKISGFPEARIVRDEKP
jgi:small-conductance mechanosensitive channel